MWPEIRLLAKKTFVNKTFGKSRTKDMAVFVRS